MENIIDEKVACGHIDTVGSFDCSAMENIAQLATSQANAGLHAVTDGHWTRHYWDLDFFTGFNGLEQAVIDTGRVYQDYAVMTHLLRMTDKISFSENHPVFDEFTALAAVLPPSTVAKQTMPAPAWLFSRILNESDWRNFYSSPQELAEDIVSAYRLTIEKLYSLGCRFIQFDDCAWGPLCDDNGIKELLLGGTDVTVLMNLLLDIDNDAIDGVPADMRTALYICRGNYDSPRRPDGDYSLIAPVLFPAAKFDALYLDLNVDGSNDFSVLSLIPAGKCVMLGLLSPTEDPSAWIDKTVASVNKAAEYYDLVNLGLTFRRGLRNKAMVDSGEHTQWDRIAMMRDIASRIWN